MRFTRFLRNDAVTADEMVRQAAAVAAVRAAGRDVVVVQDTSELTLGGRRARKNGYGPVGKGGGLGGLLLHAAMHRGFDDFRRIKYGATLRLADV